MSDNITNDQAAEILGIRPSTLEAWRSRGVEHQPPFFKIGKRVVYSRAEVERWKASRRGWK